MKNLRAIFQLFMLSSVLSVTSCSKDDNPVAPIVQAGSNADSYITCKVDGSNFTTLIYGTSTASASRITVAGENIISILGGDLETNSVSIKLDNITTTGTYTLNPNMSSVMNFSPASGAAYSTGVCDGSTGTVNVTLINDQKIEGTFTFTGKDTENCSSSKNITEGAFRGTWQD